MQFYIVWVFEKYPKVKETDHKMNKQNKRTKQWQNSIQKTFISKSWYR